MSSRRPRRFPMRRRGAVVTAAGVLALALSGCVGAPASTPTPSPSRSVAPIFASDEEALAAAEAAYEEYLDVSAQLTGSGGEVPPALSQVATGGAYDAQVQTASDYAKEGIHSVGRRTFRTYELQSYESGAQTVAVAFYVCDDLRGLDVLNADGVSIVAADRVVDVPYLVVVEGNANSLKVSEKSLWERENFCM